MDNKNYTYLIGSLTSNNFLANSLTKEARNEFKEWIKKIIDENITALSEGDKLAIKRFLIDLNWVSEEYTKNGSFELLLSFIYKNSNINDIVKFKSIINSIILLEEIRKKFNVKYENFFRDISERDRHANVILPDNIKILTWNIGINFERAFYEISHNSDSLFKKMQVYPVSAGFDDTDFDVNKFAVIHLRGLAGAYYVSKTGIVSEYLKDWITIRDMKDEDILKNLVISYKSFIYNDFLMPTISFPTDNNVYLNLVNKKSLHIASKTNILIIIGHILGDDTFKIDKEIIEQMINLNKIYVQVPVEYKQSLFLKLKKIRPDLDNIEVEFIDNNGDFFIHNDIINAYEEL